MNRWLNWLQAMLVVGLAIILSACGCAKKAAQPEGRKLGRIGEMNLEITLDPAKHRLDAGADFRWSADGADTLFFLLNRNLAIAELQRNTERTEPVRIAEGEALIPVLEQLTGNTPDSADISHLALYGLPVEPGEVAGAYTISYSGEVYDEVDVASFSRWEIADQTTGIVSEKGAFLMPGTGYYPQLPGPEDPIPFKSTITVPENWMAVAEGKQEQERNRYLFDSEHPIDGSYIVAGPYKYRKIEGNRPEIGMYYFPGSEDLTRVYLDASAGYIQRYESLLGPYPYSRFSVVENWFPTGYGMPSYTLLGSRVLRLPFIVSTSLGHEICHNWWGNGVYVDYESGNWCEGLTTYCADYLYKREESPEAARQYRLDINRDYSDYVVRGDDEDFPLRDFRERTTAGTRSIGYGKSMMVFHMVHRRIGDEAFWNSLKRVYAKWKFRKAGWDDFFAVFTEQSGVDLDWMEAQWIDREGAPALGLENVSAEEKKGSYLLEFDLRQTGKGEPYRLNVPVRVTLADGKTFEHLLRDMRGALYHAQIKTGGEIKTVEIDPDMHLFRVIDPLEAPPTLSGFFGDESPVIVVPGTGDPMATAYREFAKKMDRKETATVLVEREAGPEQLAGKTVMYLGRTDRIDPGERPLSFCGERLDGEDIAIAYAWREKVAPERVHLTIWAESPEALAPLARKLPHYGKYGYLAFSSGENILKGQWPTEDSPLRYSF